MDGSMFSILQLLVFAETFARLFATIALPIILVILVFRQHKLRQQVASPMQSLEERVRELEKQVKELEETKI